MLPSAKSTWRAAIALGSIWMMGARPVWADYPPKWLDGPALQKRLREPIGPTGSSQSGWPLRQKLAKLSRAKKVAILLDRRVDPGQKLGQSIDGDQSLRDAFGQIAQDRAVGACLFGPVVYFGPMRAASRMRTVAEMRREEVAKLAPAVRSKFFHRRPVKWDDFATPRELLQQAADPSGVKIAGLEKVPHDLWAAADLPPLDLIERLTLIAGQFDLTFQISADGSTATLVPVPDEVAVVRNYPGGSNPDALARKWAELAPDCQIKVVDQRIFVKGLLEDHERLASPERPRGPAKSDPAEPAPMPIDKIRIDHMPVKNQPLRAVLKFLGNKLALDVQVDEEAVRGAGISLDQLVSFEVKNATVDQLLAKMLEPVGLTFRREGRVVRITPVMKKR